MSLLINFIIIIIIIIINIIIIIIFISNCERSDQFRSFDTTPSKICLCLYVCLSVHLSSIFS